MAQLLQKSFPAMGTVNTITVYRQAEEYALQTAVHRVLELDDRLSVFKAGSEISQINAAAGKRFVSIGADTLGLLKAAKEFSALSEGAFSVTTHPLTELWGIGTSHCAAPDEKSRELARRLIDDRDLILDEAGGRAMLRRQRQAVDLGGIAKGFAADEARRILTEAGVTDAIINLGGTVVVMGRPGIVGIQHPGKSTGIPMGRLQLTNRAVVTSGSYERFAELNGKQCHHILNPATGSPSDSGLCSVTVIGSSAAELDALSTAVFVLGTEKGLQLAKKRGADVIFVSDEMNVFCSPALRGQLFLYPNFVNAR